MKINFIVEDGGVLQYLGCATAAKNLYNELSKNIDIQYNSSKTDFDIAHFHTFGPKSMYYLNKFQKKTIITAHSTPNLNTGNLAFPKLVNWLYLPIYNKFDHIISVSNKCKKELEMMKCTSEISTIYNGIDFKKFKPDEKKRKKFRNQYNISDKQIAILSVAQRTPRKGVYDFITAAKNFKEYKFIWIGGFPYNIFSMDYKNVIKSVENSPKNCIFPGFVEDIFEVYSGADVYFMPSYAEGHSIVMLEALSMGLPMIARDLEEFREAFSDNLIYFTDIKDINESMFSKTYLEEYKKKTEIVKTYSIDKIAQEHIKLYESLLNS